MYIVTYSYQGERKIGLLYTFKKFNRELLVRFKGFQELRIHHLAIGINKSYCSHGRKPNPLELRDLPSEKQFARAHDDVQRIL